VGSRSSLEITRPRPTGLLEEIKVQGNGVVALVSVDGEKRKLMLDMEKAARLLEIKELPSGVSLDTVIELKKKHLLGRPVALDL